MKNNKIIFINLIPHVGALPAVISSVSLLSERGFIIDFVTVKYATHIPQPNFPKVSVNEIFLPANSGSWQLIPSILINFYHTLKFLRIRKSYLCMFGVDQTGMILSVALSRIINTPVVYFPMELYLSQENTRRSQKIYKYLERVCNKRTEITIIQDDVRANLLMKDNTISLSQIVIVPNSALGRADHKRGYYFNEKYGIAKDKLIILSAGNIIGWAMSYELAESALSWPMDYVLVIHGYVQDNQHEYMERIKRLTEQSNSIIISQDMVPYEELDYMHSSADIGLALYNPQQHTRTSDFEHVGLASGKLMRYLKVGLPVITSNLPNLKKLMDQYKCGLYVNHPNEIVDSLNMLSANFNEYSLNSIIAYNEEFEFTRHFDKVVTRIRKW